jgi:hypothetical protein|tara:strand:+ start:1328 stop:2692 length:1365 start_codon:yes stop_codon:yes gene_type:complete
MPRLVNAAPPAKAHLATLSRIGYDFNTAVSDILDNSIAAKAQDIRIEFFLSDNAAIFFIIDDGSGMTESELIKNMSIGCKDPSEDRVSGDLGRFGAGLKTASFSQAGVVTVITKTADSCLSAAVWDKSIIEEHGWQLQVLDPVEIKEILPPNNDYTGKGTIVRWDGIDIIKALLHSPDKQLQIDKLCDSLHSHIALYFHRFLSESPAIKIKINNRLVSPIDPFMNHIKGSEELPTASLRGGKVGKDRIEIQPYRLPFLSNMSQSDIDYYGGEVSIRQNQGLYIYRERRLIIAGQWMGLQKYSSLAGLTRIKVDIPSSLDNEWSTDVKKSSLQIPPKIKDQIKRLISKPVASSRGAYTYRGRQETANQFWLINKDERNNLITYEIDPTNSDLRAITDRLSPSEKRQFVQYLTSLSAAIPINHIYASMGNSSRSIAQNSLSSDEKIKALIASLNDE